MIRGQFMIIRVFILTYNYHELTTYHKFYVTILCAHFLGGEARRASNNNQGIPGFLLKTQHRVLRVTQSWLTSKILC